MKKNMSTLNAYTLLRQSELGVLSTHSKSNEGFPFGSVSTYMSTVNGDVIFYISDLAQHTQNLLANNKMCLTVFSGSEGAKNENDPNDGARLSLLGEVTLIDEINKKTTAERFFKLYPESRRYQVLNDFKFYKLSVHRARFIGGFGDINWVNQEQWALPSPEWLDTEDHIVSHMNEDHADAMQLICQHKFKLNTDSIKMLTLTPDGCFLLPKDKKPLFVKFEELAFNSQDVRQQLVKLTQDARTALEKTK